MGIPSGVAGIVPKNARRMAGMNVNERKWECGFSLTIPAFRAFGAFETQPYFAPASETTRRCLKAA